MSGETPEPTTVWTVGHSTRALEEFVGILRSHGIARIADVRAFPASRRHPHFARDALERSLEAAGLSYAWLGDTLGGRRRARAGSRHAAIRSESFRAYADHMETETFRTGVRRLLDLAREKATAAMCAEVLWWRCHRSFLADHLVLVEGVRVLHLLDAQKVEPHRPKREARVLGGTVVYDVVSPGRPEPPGLFDAERGAGT